MYCIYLNVIIFLFICVPEKSLKTSKKNFLFGKSLKFLKNVEKLCHRTVTVIK